LRCHVYVPGQVVFGPRQSTERTQGPKPRRPRQPAGAAAGPAGAAAGRVRCMPCRCRA